MPRKCTVIHCKGNYDSSSEKVTVYGFPKDEEERRSWVRALPNIVDVTNTIGVCERHWPIDAPMKKIKRFCRPVEPPSIFPSSIPTSCIPTTSGKPRNTSTRLFTAESRQIDEFSEFNVMDMLPTWSSFVDIIDSSELITVHKLYSVKLPNCVKLIHFDEKDRTEFIVTIRRDYFVSASRSYTSVNLRDLLGFQYKATRWSQLDAIIIRTKHQQLCPSTEVCEAISLLQSKLENSDDSQNHKRQFLCDQLIRLYGIKKYDASIFKVSCDLFFSARSAYSRLRKILTLPHPDTIKRQFGRFGKTGSEEEAEKTVKFVLQKLQGLQLHFCIMFDEIYVKPSVRFRACHVIGKAEDQTEKSARTVLAFMLKPLFSSESFVVRLIPVFSLTGEILYEQLRSLICIIHKHGGNVRCLISDNASVNGKCYKLMSAGQDKNWIGNISEFPDKKFFLLHDSVHLFKCLRNNWLSEKLREIEFSIPGKSQVIARFEHIRDLYKSECEKVVRRTPLTRTACFPSNLELQKVNLVFQVFHEKNVAALICDEKYDTASFIDCFLRLWKILNCKHPNAHVLLNDPDRRPFISTDDDRLKFLEEMADCISHMSGGQGAQRQRSLTTSTRDAFVQTLKGLAEMGRELLHDTACNYLMFGVFQTDPLESEFGVYRQYSGGNYYIGVEQILNSAHFRKLQLYNRLDISDVESSHSSMSCCDSDFDETESLMMDMIVDEMSSISDSEKSALFYICGYVAFKENLSSDTCPNNICESEFTHLVNRGKLSFPPECLFQFSMHVYSYFNLCRGTCSTRTKRAFHQIMQCYDFDFAEKSLSICRRLTNCFYKGMVRKETDILLTQEHQKLCERRKRKLTSSLI